LIYQRNNYIGYKTNSYLGIDAQVAIRGNLCWI